MTTCPIIKSTLSRQTILVLLLSVFPCLTTTASVFKDFIHTYTNTAIVDAVYVDRNGTAWVGTSYGLMHYDDLKHGHSIRLAMPEELRVPVHFIYGLNDGRMVVTTRSLKKYIFNPETYRIEELDDRWIEKMGIESPGPWTIGIISNGHNNAVLESEGKIYTIDFASGDKARYITELDEPARSLSIDSRYCHIVTPSYIYSYEFNSDKVTRIKSASNPYESFATHVIMDGEGNLWKGDQNLYRHNHLTDTWEKLRDNVMVTEIARSGSDIYVGTSTQGILHYGDNGKLRNTLHNDPFDINTPVSDHCAMVYVDNDDNLWVTYSKGDLSISSHYYNLTKAHHIEKLMRQGVKDDIISLLPVGENTLLIGTDGNGLHLVDAETGLATAESGFSQPSVTEPVITSLFLDSRKRLWIGAYRSGLICIDNGIQHRFLDQTSPYSIVEDIDGNIFIGTSGNGLYRISSDLKNEPLKVDLNNEQWIQQLSCDRSATIYVITSSQIYSIDSQSLKSDLLIEEKYQDKKLLFNNFDAFCRDSRKLLWLIGDENDIFLKVLDINNDTVYTIPELADIKFKSVIEDNNKNMWLASDNDIYNIVPQYNPTTRSYSFRHFVYHIRSNEGTPNKYNYRAVTKLPDGRLVFSGMNGYLIIDPIKYQELGLMTQARGNFSALKINNHYVIPNESVDGTIILDKEISHTDKITLDSYNNNLNFMFSPRDYDSPFKIEYYYRLDSTKTAWHPITGNNIELINLTPGRYHLEVCAMSPEGFMSEEIDGIDIEILSPWYRTLWAYMLYFLLLLLVLTTVIYYFTDRQKQKLRVAQAEKEMARQHQLNEMKLRFFTNISHDFRTPLSLIITPLESYINTHPDAETSKFLSPVHRNAVRLLNLVNQILDFRKLDVTGVPLHLSYGDIVSYTKEICSSFNLFSEDSDIKLNVTSEAETLNMYFDKDKVSKIMMNILSNAFKYTDHGGSVTVCICRDGDFVKISISDTGKGIPDKDKPHIFDRFYQSGNRQHTTMGCGIGLHIVKEFVQLHEGYVDVADNNPCGTIFTVSLPIKKNIGDIEDPIDNNIRTLPANSLEIPASENTRTELKPTILLVEDNQDFIEFMEQSLNNDYHVLKAGNGLEALEILNRDTVNIVISDVMMDKMDGLELCHAVKSDISTSHIPVILLTAKSLAEDEMKGLESGADDYITKPFSMPILRQRISKLIDESRLSRDKFRRIPDIAPSEITITPLDEQFLSDAIRVVEENMSNPDFSVEMLSANLGMHRTHLYKKLSCITGKTPIEFIRLIRLKRAAQYLAQSQMYISEIAYKVGFNNPRLLSKYFKEEYNMTPREYIRSLGIDSSAATEE